MFDNKYANIAIFLFIIFFVGGIMIFLRYRNIPTKATSSTSIAPSKIPASPTKTASISGSLTPEITEASISAKPITATPSGKKR